jgi:hypothetical protein
MKPKIHKPSGKTISIGWIGCRCTLAGVDMLSLLYLEFCKISENKISWKNIGLISILQNSSFKNRAPTEALFFSWPSETAF